jgi:bifunctional UDP-N-acetylglucosamine pyrophosphorylase / glucosamine-1-phosphate N-acetyltransferase
MISNLFIILAAGKGTRMKSALPKVMHKIAGTAMIDICISKVLNSNYGLGSKFVIVCSQDNIEEISKTYAGNDAIATTIQHQRLGTGHAVSIGLDKATEQWGEAGFAKLAVLYGDTPLFKMPCIDGLLQGKNDVNFAGFVKHDPGMQFGRFVFDARGQIIDIVEFKDATEEQRQNLNTFNAGFAGGSFAAFKALLPLLKNNNKAEEFYLTDLARLAPQNGFTCGFVPCTEAEAFGVNDRLDLSKAEALLQQELRESFMKNGVSFTDPASVFLSLDTKIEADVTIEPNVFIGKGVEIKSGAVIKAFCYLEGATIEEGANIGPFARIRGTTKIGKKCKIGNFVEIKNSKLNTGVKAGHLAYIGDAELGKDVNIGAGAVFCNYDGVLKHKAIVGEGAFIGSNTSIISPVNIGKNALIAAASVVDGDVAEDAIYISRPQGKTAKQSASQYFASKK